MFMVLKSDDFTPHTILLKSDLSIVVLTVVVVFRLCRPQKPLFAVTVSITKALPPSLLAISMPLFEKPKIVQCSIWSALPLVHRIPLSPGLPLPKSPLILMLRMVTTSLAAAWTTIPLVPATRTEATWPPPPSRVMALVMVTAPNPPGSRASISPPGAVLEMAPAQVLQGAVRLQGLTSSPTPETQVRLAWALSSVVPSRITARAPIRFLLCICNVPPDLFDPFLDFLIRYCCDKAVMVP